MKIRAGYEISYDCLQPTPMMLTLSVHPSRFSDLQTPDLVRLDPPVPANTYHDGFGNFCHVIRAPAGRLTVSADFVVHDGGAPDEVAPKAAQHSLEMLKKAAAQEPNSLTEGSVSSANTMPYIIDAVRAYATVGEISAALRDVYGTYTEVSIT